MKNWEKLMKEQEQYLLSKLNKEKQLPPIRNSSKKKPATRESKNTENSKRMKSHDHTAWEKFDADKACDDLEEEKESDDLSNEFLSEDRIQQNHKEAIEYKEEGNHFVRQKKWDKAIASYSKAIKLFPYDAIFFANRALCFLKQDNLYSAEADCSSSIQIDDTYVKAYHRRATARMGLKHYKEAKLDIEKVLTLAPSNKEAKALLSEINKRLKNFKPVITSEEDIANDISVEKKIAEKKLDDVESNKKIIDIKEDNNENSLNIKSTAKPTNIIKQTKNLNIPDWLPEKDNVKIVEPVEKPPHLRSKEPFRRIPVQEADLTKPFKEEIKTSCYKIKDLEFNTSSDNITEVNESVTKTKSAVEENFTKICTEIPPVPKTAVHFIISWRKYTSSDFRYKYLKQLPPGSLPKIFKESLESNIFSDILATLKTEFINRKESIFSYLKDLSDVRRFRALIMFISNSEKQDLKLMFSYCKISEKISEKELMEIQNRYEI
ncbi:RNA polymerase II-associated protein 3 isoform X2 [Odontomachus brunneus]|nr:RNA polymerase II-associated protein 3 isoform X2 [Odontomachus brunneus]